MTRQVPASLNIGDRGAVVLAVAVSPRGPHHPMVFKARFLEVDGIAADFVADAAGIAH